MKKHTRTLLSILPLLPFLMANSAVPRPEEYKDITVTYKSEESLYNYNFYHLDIKNVGEGYLSNLYMTSQHHETPFSVELDMSEVYPPFSEPLIQPGFDKEVVVATKNKIPESKSLLAYSYDYYIAAEGFKFSKDKTVGFDPESSNVSSNYFVYKVNTTYTGDFEDYYYSIAIKLTYDGETYYVRSYYTESITILAHEQLDLTKLTIEDLIMLRSPRNYNTGYDDIGGNFAKAMSSVLLFLLVFFLLLGFGIFSAIFFPAMARRKRQRALQEQNNM